MAPNHHDRVSAWNATVKHAENAIKTENSSGRRNIQNGTQNGQAT